MLYNNYCYLIILKFIIFLPVKSVMVEAIKFHFFQRVSLCFLYNCICTQIVFVMEFTMYLIFYIHIK